MLQFFVDAFVGGIVGIVLTDRAPRIESCYHLQHPSYQYAEKLLSALPPCSEGSVRVIVVSDTHDCHDRLPSLPECDSLIHCGDVMMTSKYFSPHISMAKLQHFNDWLGKCPAKERIVIGGNHDTYMEKIGADGVQSILTNAKYFVNNTFSIGNLRAWATPLSHGRSPNRAFQSSVFRESTIESAPGEVDILITHGYCKDLVHRVKHKVHIWGHSHNSYGVRYPGDQLKVKGQAVSVNSLSICAPLMNGRFRMRNLPIVIDLPISNKGLESIPTAEQVQRHAFSYKQRSLSGRFLELLSEEEDGTVAVKEKPASRPALRISTWNLGKFSKVAPSKYET